MLAGNFSNRTVFTLGVLSWIFPSWRFISVTVASSGVLLICKWGFPVLRMVSTLEFIALVEDTRLRPNSVAITAEIFTGTRYPAWPMMYPQMGASCRREYLLVTGGHDGLRLLQFLVFLHAVPQSWHQRVSYQVIRLGTVHNHRDAVGVGVQTPSIVASHQSRKCESLIENTKNVEGRLLVVVGGR